MGPRATLKSTVAALAMMLLAACTGGGDRGNAPATTATPLPSSAKPLPASLAQAKGWLVYSTFIGDNDRIHLTRPDGSQDHELFTDLQGDVIRADFSHDGRLAFEHRPPQQVHNVYIAKADGTGARVIAKCEYGKCEREYPAWSPDSQQLVTTLPPYHFDVGPGELYTLKPDGSGLHALTRYGASGPRAAHPRFTPDSKTILFIRAATKTWDTPPRHLYALELASGQEVPVLTKRDIYTRPSLQP